MTREWKTINSKVIYSNPWIKLHKDSVFRPGGKEGLYVFLERHPAVFIIAQDENDFVYLISEYRYPIKKNILQLPAGGIDKGNVIEQAQKELREETGILAKKWKKIGGFYVAPGHETTYIEVVLATELNLSGLTTDNQECDEAIQEIIKISIPELKQMILDGKIEDGITLAALNLFFLRYKVESSSKTPSNMR